MLELLPIIIPIVIVVVLIALFVSAGYGYRAYHIRSSQKA